MHAREGNSSVSYVGQFPWDFYAAATRKVAGGRYLASIAGLFDVPTRSDTTSNCSSEF